MHRTASDSFKLILSWIFLPLKSHISLVLYHGERKQNFSLLRKRVATIFVFQVSLQSAISVGRKSSVNPRRCLKSELEAIVDIVASNIGTPASNILTYHFQPVCSIYLIPLSGKNPLCLRPGVIAAICLLESSFIEEQLQ